MPKNTHLRPRRTWAALLLAGLLSLLAAACGPEPAPPVPTRTPAPTFTPTPPVEPTPVDPAAAATIQAAEAATAQAAQPPAAEQPAAEAPQAEAPPAEAPPAEAPTETPTPAPAAEVVATSNMNVRGGPGTTYNILGAANQGQRFPVKGKNPDGTWWQIDYNGQDGWVFGELVTASNTGSVQVAANIPAPPPPPTPAPPTNTPPPPPPAEPTAPPPPPKPTYKFNVTAVSKCAPQEAGTWFEGRTYINGQPSNGYRVVFSYEPDGPWVTEPMITGPHKGYEGWNTGYYSHIISASGNGPKEGNWFVWVVDEGGNRISEIANWQSKGKGGDCNQAAVDFDSRQ